jgi:hypothetical protein
MSTLTYNITDPIKNTLDEVPHSQSYSEVYENNTKPTQEKA